MKLWYEQPANNWEEALPLGNGHLGSMVYGDILNEKIQLNDETLWYRGKVDRNNPDSAVYLDEIRELILQGKIEEAEKLISLTMYATPRDQSHYETLGDLLIHQNNIDESSVTEYKRELNLENAIHTVSYKVDNVSFNREYFISKKYNSLVIKYSASESNLIDLEINLNREKKFNDSVSKIKNNGVSMSGKLGGENGISFGFGCQLFSLDGDIQVLGETIIGKNMSEAIIVLASDTNYWEPDKVLNVENKLIDIGKIKFDEIRKDHILDYSNQYNRIKLDLHAENKNTIPTNQRLLEVQNGGKDLGLIELYFNYGRYLLISSSQPGGLPANLQGIWNEDLNPIWGSKYTININIQMNYWLSGPCQLSELEHPLFDMLENMRENGRVTARKMYNAKGFTAHHNTDGFYDTAPQSHTIGAAVWPMSIPWLCTHIWENYQFTGNKTVLEKYFPIMKEAAYFYEDYLFEIDGELLTGPSVSPENKYRLSDGTEGNVCLSPSIDSQILRYFFKSSIEISKLIEDDSKFVDTVTVMLNKLPKDKIGKYGQIQEWREDYEEAEPGHRHMSHLFALHPSNEINETDTPELFAAAKKTIERRLEHGNYQNEFDRNKSISDWQTKGVVSNQRTGWSSAWLINHFARLKEGECAFNELYNLLKFSTLPNLFDDHPPFQIDGNFGGTAGICEMLVQSHSGVIELLPALPKEIESGSIEGIKARGNVVLSFDWEKGIVKNIKLETDEPKEVKICLRGSHTPSGLDWNFSGIINKVQNFQI